MPDMNDAKRKDRMDNLIAWQADLLQMLLRQQARLELYRDGRLQPDESKIEEIVNGQASLIDAARHTNDSILGAVKSTHAQAAEVDGFLKCVSQNLGARFADSEKWRVTVLGTADWRRAAAQIGRERTNCLTWRVPDLTTGTVLLSLVELLDEYGFTPAERRDFLESVRVSAS